MEMKIYNQNIMIYNKNKTSCIKNTKRIIKVLIFGTFQQPHKGFTNSC